MSLDSELTLASSCGLVDLTFVTIADLADHLFAVSGGEPIEPRPATLARGLDQRFGPCIVVDQLNDHGDRVRRLGYVFLNGSKLTWMDRLRGALDAAAARARRAAA